MHTSHERGAAAVEFALIFPVLMWIVSIIIDGGRLYAIQAETNHVAFMAARSVAIGSASTAAAAVATQGGSAYSLGSSTTCPSTGTGNVRLNVTRNYSPLFPTGLGLFHGNTLTGSGVAQCG